MEYLIVFLPLIGSLLCYFGKQLGNTFSQILSSLLVTCSAILSLIVFYNGLTKGIYGNYVIFEWINETLSQIGQ